MMRSSMKPSRGLMIPDGEYLRYAEYHEGRKYADYHFAARKTADSSKRHGYRIHTHFISVTNGKKLPKDCAEWPGYSIFDPVKGTLIENSVTCDPKDIREFKNLTHAHNVYDPETGELRYEGRVIKNGRTTERKAEIRLKPDYPFWNGASFMFYSPRVLDTRAGGWLSYANLSFAKGAMLFSFEYESRESVRTNAGAFDCDKAVVKVRAPFPFSLMMPFIPTTHFWIEDSDRRIVVKVQGTGGSEYVLEEVGMK